MIGAAYRWLRVVAPPTWAMAAVAPCWISLEALYFWLHAWAPQEAFKILRGRDFFAGAALVFYGAFRILAFHPLFQSSYRQWLMRTPWDYLRPLPMGPVFLVPQDLLAIALVQLAMHDAPLAARVGVVAAFLAAYALTVAIALFCTKTWPEAYLVAFGLGAAIWLAGWQKTGSVLVLSLLFPIASLGMWRSLKRFPWDESVARVGTKLSPTGTSTVEPAGSRTGWPFDFLNPQPRHPRFARRHAMLVSLLLGWWFYALQSLGPRHDRDYRETVGMLFLLPSGAFVAVRLVRYCGGYWSPISLWGRLWTGRWIIPGYDRVLVAPLCGCAAMTAGLVLALHTALPPGETLAVCLTLVAVSCLAMGPDLEHWRLTGGHRLSTFSFQSNTKDFERLS